MRRRIFNLYLFKISPIIPFIILMLIIAGCNSEEKELKKEIEREFSTAMDAYHDIWQAKDMAQAEILAKKAFNNKEIINEVLQAYKASLEIDQGINLTEEKYNISVINHESKTADLKVKATLKGFPISLTSGHKKTEKLQDFSFGPHNFKMTKEQGDWKISSF
ncbi:MAG: hypothetical protein JM58_03820 [Peptococcaceae bacterium BICA1-8]|nr:MAG: hypothetical protein JM58_03820 [Peptococcaceae bacterium BICA1-8]